jgi:hypothetical protein
MKYLKYLVYAAVMALAVPASAQSGSGFILSYPISFPMGNMHDYVEEISFRGLSMEFIKRVKPGVSVGLETGWHVFYQREDSKEYKDGNTSISGIQYRYVNAVPILVQAKYYKETSSPTTFYGGLGLGVLYVDQSTDMGLYRLSKEAWQFCLRPELGVLFKTQSGASPFIGAKYYAGFNANDLDGQSFLSLNIGILFSSR